MIELAPLRFEPVKTRSPQFAEKTEGAEKMVSGVIVRHLIMPGCFDNTVKVLDWLKEHADGKACISLMSQYTPVGPVIFFIASSSVKFSMRRMSSSV